MNNSDKKGQNEMMNFELDPPKKNVKMPKLGQRNKKKIEKNPKNSEEKTETNNEQIKNTEKIDQPKKEEPQQKIEKNLIPEKKSEEKKDENQSSSELRQKIVSLKFNEREEGYKELLNWADPTYTKTDFIKELDNLAKEKHWKVLGFLINAIQSVCEEDIFLKNLNFESFFQNFLENMMSNAKGESKTELDKFIPVFWDCWENKEQFISEINNHLTSTKIKIQEKICSFLEELMKSGNWEELKNLKPLEKNLIQLIGAKSPIIRKCVIGVFKEAYLWLGPNMQGIIDQMEPKTKKEFENYIKELNSSDLKIGQKKPKKEKKHKEEKLKEKSEEKNESNKKDENESHQLVRENSQINQKNDDEEKKDLSEIIDIQRRLSKDLNNEVQKEIEELDNLDDIKTSLFSEKNLNIENAEIQQKILLLHLKNVLKITEYFTQVTKVQQKILYSIFEKIIEKYPANSFTEPTHQVFATFFVEQIWTNYKESLFQLINKYTKSEKNLTQPKDLLVNMFNVISKKNLPATKELINSLARLIENEIVAKKNISFIPMKNLINFITKTKNILQEKDLKDRIFNLMRNIQDIFGKNALGEFSQQILKDFENQNKEIEKKFNKTMTKLKERNPEKRKTALFELENETDISLIQMLWSSSEFQNFIKRSLITETFIESYQKILQIIENYLQFHRNSPADFSLQNFLYVFHTIITQFYDIKDITQDALQKKRMQLLQNIFNKTIERLEPTIIFNQLINDSNAQNWKEQICGFYLQYSETIQVDHTFMDYIIDAYSQRKNVEGDNQKSLIEKVIIALKNAKNQEILEKGGKNKQIKKIWQQSEEEVLFSSDFVEYEKIFRDKGFYEQVRKFIIKALEIDEKVFHHIKIDTFIIDGEKNTQTKAQLAYMYLRSNENLNHIAEHIYNQIIKLDFSLLDNISLQIIFRTLLNLMKNFFYGRESDQLFRDIVDLFGKLVHEERLTQDQLNDFAFQPSEWMLYQYALKHYNMGQHEEEDEQVSAINVDSRMYDTHMEQNLSKNNYFPRNDNLSINTPNQENAFKRKNSRISKNQFLDDISQNNYFANQDQSQIIQDSQSHMSRTSLSKKKQMIGIKQSNPDQKKEFSKQMENLLTYDMKNVEEAKEYLLKLLKSPAKEDQYFLAEQIDEIFPVYKEMFEAIFESGINYDVDLESYKLIFEPLKQISSKKSILYNVKQEELNEMVRELLYKLVTCNEEKTHYEKVEKNDEKFEYCSQIVKYFNSIMLRILENININSILMSLFLILFQSNNREKDPIVLKVFSLDLLCLNRISKNIKKQINEVNPSLVLSLIRKYIDEIGIDNNEMNKKGTQIIRVFLREIVYNFDNQTIWRAYAEVFGDIQNNEHILFKYIVLLQDRAKQEQQNKTFEEQNILKDEIMKIISMINKENSQSQLPVYLKQLWKLIEDQPGIVFKNFRQYFQNQQFFNYLQNEIEKLRKAQQRGGEGGLIQATPQKMEEFLNQSNLSFLTNKSNLGKNRINKQQNNLNIQIKYNGRNSRQRQSIEKLFQKRTNLFKTTHFL